MNSTKSTSKGTLNYFIILLLGGLAALSSCGDDDGASGNLPLEGTTWIETNFTTSNCDDPDDNEVVPSDCNDSECFTLNLSNGVVTFVNFEDGSTETITGTFTVSGNTITANILGGTLQVNFNINGSTLTLVFEDPFDGCTTTIVYRGA